MTRQRQPTAWEIEMGMRLQQLRRKAGLSQSQLARAADVPIGSLRNWEHGRRTPLLDAAARLARALSVTLDELAGIGHGEPEKKKRKER